MQFSIDQSMEKRMLLIIPTILCMYFFFYYFIEYIYPVEESLITLGKNMQEVINTIYPHLITVFTIFFVARVVLIKSDKLFIVIYFVLLLILILWILSSTVSVRSISKMLIDTLRLTFTLILITLAYKKYYNLNYTALMMDAEIKKSFGKYYWILFVWIFIWTVLRKM